MQIFQIYAAAAGGLLALIIILQSLSALRDWLQEQLAPFVLRILVYPFFLGRHLILGPCTRFSVVVHALYWAATVFCILYKTSTASEISIRVGNLSLINAIPLYAAVHLSMLADALRMSLPNLRHVHGSVGLMTGALATAHVGLSATTGTKGLIDSPVQIFGLAAIAALVLLLLLSIRPLRRPLYELFLRSHQGLAIFFQYAAWRHTQGTKLPIRIWIYLSVAAFASSALLQILQLLYRNLSMSQGSGRASLTKLRPKRSKDNYSGKDTLFIDITVPRAWNVRAGQYVNLWMPFFSLRSMFQSHPYMIVYWTEGTSLSLCFLVEAQGGLTRKLFERAYEVDSFQMKPGEERQIPLEHFHRAWLSGPHGHGAPVGEFGSVLMIATDIGIAAQLPYLKELISGFNHCQVRTRRIHLVWQVGCIDDELGAIGIINRMLDDDLIDQGHILRISIYFEHEDPSKGGTSGGAGNRVKYYKGSMVLDQLLRSQMVDTDHINDELVATVSPLKGRGKLLVTVSANNEVRDRIRSLVTQNVRENVRLMELEFQPSAQRLGWSSVWKRI